MDEINKKAYDQGHQEGVESGRILARLDGYDKHFNTINGSVADTAKALSALTLAVQRLGDQADASAATVLATASALKAADEARRDKTEQSWSPWQKVLATLAGIATVIGIIIALRSTIK